MTESINAHIKEANRLQSELDSLGDRYGYNGPVRTILRERIAKELKIGNDEIFLERLKELCFRYDRLNADSECGCLKGVDVYTFVEGELNDD